MFFDTKEVEWSDTEVRIAGSRLTKLRGIKYGVKTEKTHLHAEGERPRGIQTGNKTYQGEIKLLVGALDDMHRATLAAGGDDVTDLEFEVVITYKARGNRALKTVTLVGCQITEASEGWDQGAKEMEVTLPILFLDLVKAA